MSNHFFLSFFVLFFSFLCLHFFYAALLRCYFLWCIEPPQLHQVDKLRKDNDGLKTANDSLRRERQQERQKALSTFEASGMSYHALNQTVKALSASKQKLIAEVISRPFISVHLYAFMLFSYGTYFCTN